MAIPDPAPEDQDAFDRRFRQLLAACPSVEASLLYVAAYLLTAAPASSDALLLFATGLHLIIRDVGDYPPARIADYLRLAATMEAAAPARADRRP